MYFVSSVFAAKCFPQFTCQWNCELTFISMCMLYFDFLLLFSCAFSYGGYRCLCYRATLLLLLTTIWRNMPFKFRQQSFNVICLCENLSGCADLRSISDLQDGVPEDHKASLYMHVFHVVPKTHRNTQVCVVSSACGVTVSYRLIKPIHHFSQHRQQQEDRANTVWNNQHLFIFLYILSWFGWTFWSLHELLSINCPHTWPYMHLKPHSFHCLGQV